MFRFISGVCTGKQASILNDQIPTLASYDANSSHIYIFSVCTIIIFQYHNLSSTYIQLPKFLTAKVEETLRMSTTTRSTLPILPITILPTILPLLMPPNLTFRLRSVKKATHGSRPVFFLLSLFPFHSPD